MTNSSLVILNQDDLKWENLTGHCSSNILLVSSIQPGENYMCLE